MEISGNVFSIHLILILKKYTHTLHTLRDNSIYVEKDSGVIFMTTDSMRKRELIFTFPVGSAKRQRTK